MTSFADFEYEKSSNDKKVEVKKPDEDFVRKAYDELKNLDGENLEKKLISEVKQQKSNGTFNLPLLEESIESIRPFMSEDSYLNLKNLLGRIK